MYDTNYVICSSELGEAYEWVVLWIWMNKACHGTRTWASDVTPIDGQCRRIRMNQVTSHVWTNWRTYQWIVGHMRKSHATNRHIHTHTHTQAHIYVYEHDYICIQIYIYTHQRTNCPVLYPRPCRYAGIHCWGTHTTLVSVCDQSSHSYGWVRMGHFTHMDALGHTCRSATSRILMSRVTLSEFKHAANLYKYEWGVTSHVWLNHITRINELCHTYKWVVSHV